MTAETETSRAAVRGPRSGSVGVGVAARPMRFTVDGWDPSYGTSLEIEEQALEESTATVTVDVEVPANRWRPIDPNPGCSLPAGLLFVDGVRRVEARVWIDDLPSGEAGPEETGPGEIPGERGPRGTGEPGRTTEATAGLCASYAAGVVCCVGQQAHLVKAEVRRGLFSVAAHASDVVTRAGRYRSYRVGGATGGAIRGAAGGTGAGVPLLVKLSQALQRRLADVEMATAVEARTATHGHRPVGDDDLLIIDGPLRGRQHLPRVLGYIKSHRSTYLPPDLNALVGALDPGQRTPVFLMGTSWERHSWYLRLPGPPGAPWAGVVRIECAADLPLTEVIGLADVSQGCLGRFASDSYKDSRAPQNLYPIGGLERELRHRLGDSRLLYRALREASHPR